MNWFLGFVMGLLLAAGYNRIVDIQEESKRQQDAAGKVETQQIIEAYKAGSKDVLKLNPIDPRLESTCIQIWGMKQND
jgi:hypothetical protein